MGMNSAPQFQNNNEAESAPSETTENAPDYGGKVFDSPAAELTFLQRLQGGGSLDGVEWNRETHFPRMKQLMEDAGKIPSQEAIAEFQKKRERFTELTKLQAVGGPAWTPELQEEVKALYPIMEKGM
jgi:hypothetical protein